MELDVTLLHKVCLILLRECHHRFPKAVDEHHFVLRLYYRSVENNLAICSRACHSVRVQIVTL